MMSVLVCSTDFNPAIKNTPLYKSITLGKDTMKEVAQDGYVPHYFISGATAPSYLIDEIPGTNPTKYQTFYFGVNDACDFDPNDILKDPYYYDNFIPDNEINTEDSKIRSLRENMPINIIAITAPLVNLEDLRSDFFIGVDRIQLRVLPHYTDEFLKDIY